MFETDATFHAPTFWLKAVAELNACDNVVTDATFHFDTSALNAGLLANSDAMLVTAAVFQYAIGPYVAAAVVGLVAHAVTAVPMLPSVRHVGMPELPQLHVGYAAWSVAPHIM
jgi:hypothetical protein